MKKQAAHPKFNMTYGELLQLADDVMLVAQRDTNDLKKYAIDAPYLTAFQSTINVFRNMESDAYYEGQVSIKTRDKNAIRENVQAALSGLMVRVKNVFGANSPEYNRFQTSDASRLPDSDFARMARNAGKVAEVYLAALGTKGFTQGDLDELNDSIQRFDEQLNEKHAAERARDTATQQRVEAANAVYDHITEICDYGKDYYYSRDEAKYNDYVIYGASTVTDAPANGSGGTAG